MRQRLAVTSESERRDGGLGQPGPVWCWSRRVRQIQSGEAAGDKWMTVDAVDTRPVYTDEQSVQWLSRQQAEKRAGRYGGRG